MRKIYKISVFNTKYGKREIMYERYTSKKKAQEIADKINACDSNGVICAMVMVEIRV